MSLFSFKRKNKEGKKEEQPVTQEEFDTLEANSATYGQVLELFGEDAQQEGFDVVTAIQNLIDSNSAIAEAFGEAADAEDFDAIATITALQAESEELGEISSLVSSLKGETTLEKVKTIQPAKKTNALKTAKEQPKSDAGNPHSFQNVSLNREGIKELAKRGVRLASVDYSTFKLN